MFVKALSLLAMTGLAAAHMHIHYPPTLKGDNNPYTQGNPDPLLNYPYGCCGKEAPGPCKGHVGLLNTDEGRPVATWAAGQNVNFTLSGAAINTPTENPKGGTHYGGSCQAGFSVDGGKTFKVASTWQGDCPLRDGTVDPSTQVFHFTVPADTPSTERALFAWTWVNREKEFNMGCSSVTISGQNDKPALPASSATPQKPSQAQPSPSTPTGSTQYKLEGCTCACPAKTWSSGCSCYDCESPTTKRSLVERAALKMHKRNMQNAEKLDAPVRRAEAVAFNSRPDMLLEIDYSGASCHSQGNTVELEYPNPGPNVVQGDGEYKLEPPSC